MHNIDPVRVQSPMPIPQKNAIVNLVVVNEVFLKQSIPHPTQSYKAEQPSPIYKENKLQLL